MNCPRCNESVESGAAFCGNCGQALGFQQPLPPQPPTPQTNQPVAQFQPPAHAGQVFNNAAPNPQAAASNFVPAGAPAYALSAPAQHSGETKALLSLILGIIGLLLCIIPIAGLALAITGLILGTLTRHSHKKTLSTLGLIFSSLAILASLGFWTYAILNSKNNAAKNNVSGNNTAAVATASIKTPCYNIDFVHEMNTDSDKSDSCDVRVYEGATIEQSNDVYKVYGNEVSNITEATFYNSAKAAIEKDVSSTLPGFTIATERVGTFAGSPAYIVNVSQNQTQIAVVEAAVLHKVGAGYNVFSVVHATKGQTTDLKALETQWQWK
jgi:hypothetical protein